MIQAMRNSIQKSTSVVWVGKSLIQLSRSLIWMSTRSIWVQNSFEPFGNINLVEEKHHLTGMSFNLVGKSRLIIRATCEQTNLAGVSPAQVRKNLLRCMGLPGKASLLDTTKRLALPSKVRRAACRLPRIQHALSFLGVASSFGCCTSRLAQSTQKTVTFVLHKCHVSLAHKL